MNFAENSLEKFNPLLKKVQKQKFFDEAKKPAIGKPGKKKHPQFFLL